MRFRHWRVYGAAGLAGHHAAVWLYGERPTVAFAAEPLAHNASTYQPDKRHLRMVSEPQLFETPHRSPQLPLWALGAGERLRVLCVPVYARRKRHRSTGTQSALFAQKADG